jgi:hypothetical protein
MACFRDHRTLTASMIDRRNFLAAKRRAENRGDAAARTQGRLHRRLRVQRPHRIWARLDRVQAKHPGMVLLHGGSPKGVERIAACWADARKVWIAMYANITMPDCRRSRRRVQNARVLINRGGILCRQSGITSACPPRLSKARPASGRP